MKRAWILVAAPAAAAALVAGCGGSGGSGGGQAVASSPASAYGARMSQPVASTSSVATVKVRKTSLGRILVDQRGRTLYLWEKDKHGKSACNGACATAWPPLITTGRPKAASGASASKLGTTRRSDGKRQVTYAGHPLYGFIQDKKAGDTKGQGSNAFGAEWYVLSPSGKKIEKKGS